MAAKNVNLKVNQKQRWSSAPNNGRNRGCREKGRKEPNRRIFWSLINYFQFISNQTLILKYVFVSALR